MPDGGVDIITERKIFWSKDIIMTMIRLLLIPISISKIIINLNIFKEKFISFFNIRSCGCKQKLYWGSNYNTGIFYSSIYI